jgi:hypothetical protein
MEGDEVVVGTRPSYRFHPNLLPHSTATEAVWFNRTQEYEARNRGESFHERQFASPEIVTLEPLPFREASERLRSGERNARFPIGCFPPALPFVSG